jgi:hypothetical protein
LLDECAKRIGISPYGFVDTSVDDRRLALGWPAHGQNGQLRLLRDPWPWEE